MLTRALVLATLLVVPAAILACSSGPDCSIGAQTSTHQDKTVNVTSAVACKIAEQNNVQLITTSSDYKPSAICKSTCGSDFVGCVLDYDYMQTYLDVNGATDSGNTVDPTMAACPPVPSNSVAVTCSLCGN